MYNVIMVEYFVLEQDIYNFECLVTPETAYACTPVASRCRKDRASGSRLMRQRWRVGKWLVGRGGRTKWRAMICPDDLSSSYHGDQLTVRKGYQ